MDSDPSCEEDAAEKRVISHTSLPLFISQEFTCSVILESCLKPALFVIM